MAAKSWSTPAGQYRVVLHPSQVKSTLAEADFSGLVDEQLDMGDPPSGEAATPWKVPSQLRKKFPVSVTIDLKRKMPVATLWIYDTNSSGDVIIKVGPPDALKEVDTYNCKRYKQWVPIKIDAVTQYITLEIATPGANFSEIALDAYSTQGWKSVVVAKAEAERKEAERQAALKKAREEALKRAVVDVAPYGRLSLVDEVVCSTSDPGHQMSEFPAGASSVAKILGRSCRVMKPAKDDCSYMSFRIGRRKLLRPGAAYVLAVSYPEDAPRSFVVINTGNETSRGFHTGLTTGDAMHPKYVNNLVESLDVPLSGKWENWSLLFYLHNRFPQKGMIRGTAGKRDLTPEDGFDVTIAQFNARNDPFSKGVAIGAIRLYEVIDVDKLAVKINYPPKGVPRRRLFWREEMADGVIGGKNVEDRGVTDRIEWYRHKAEQMRFLGINTYTKDLLEFGACQHWDSSPYGGNKWVYFNSDTKELWAQIVELMGKYGFDVLPYYEYSGSKGQEGLGNERRAKPLTRDDAYTHVKWIENANADITDPDTYKDFQKMLDLTIVNFQDKAHFAGAWLRPRNSLPVGFGPETLKRFAKEKGKSPVTRDQLKKDKALYEEYLAWWKLKRRDFLVAMRDYLRDKGIEDAQILFTSCASEPGKSFGDFEKRFITDSPEKWKEVLAQDDHKPDNNRQWQILTPAQVADQKLYHAALQKPVANWGGWEWHHASPGDNPLDFSKTDGVMLTHPFNRLYTVNSPATMDLFRTPSGLAMIRHHTLNENMMFNANDKDILGYFVADIERAGPYCMHAEAVAMANGAPEKIGYLVGCNYGRGFPLYVRDFNVNYLALPALPSVLAKDACTTPGVAVRVINAGKHGHYIAVVNTNLKPVNNATIRVPGSKPVTAVASGKTLSRKSGAVSLNLRPCQLVTLLVGP